MYGLIPEFVGRLPVVATLEELDEVALIQILTHPRTPYSSNTRRMFSMEGVELEVQRRRSEAVAAPRPSNARRCAGLRSILENGRCLHTLFDLPAARKRQSRSSSTRARSSDAPRC
jgi:ATP-dependent Clp protease ATP-binding subunit ClpX